MPPIDSRLTDAKPYDVVQKTDSATPGLPPLPENQPSLSSTLRSTLPPIYAATDNLRQYYSGGMVPQTRSFPAPSLTNLGTQGAQGAQGPAGTPGAQGPVGPAGPSGQPLVVRNANGVYVRTSDGAGGFTYEAWGVVSAAVTGNKFSTASITFPVAFPGNPIVTLTPLGNSDGTGNNSMSCYAVGMSATGCTANLACAVNIGGTGSAGFVNTVQVQWHAFY